MAEEEKPLFTPVEGEKAEVKEEEQAPSMDVDALMQELEKVNLTDPNKLRGKLQNAEGYKSVQAERDRLANELQSLRSEFSQVKSTNTRMDMDEFGDIHNSAIDLEATLEKILDKRDRIKEERAIQAQRAQMEAYSKITKNKYWKQVGPLFEEKMKDPEIATQVQLGQKDPVELYHETTVDFLQDLSAKSLEALQNLKKSGNVKPPHVEGTAHAPVQETDDRDDRQKKVDQLREKAKAPTGLHQDDQMELIKQALGDFIR
jgi:hypothetical protein